MSFDSITNRGEFFSNHYLDAIIGGDLGDLRRTWDEQEKAHRDTARSRLKALSKPFFAARADATEASNAANARRATETLNGHVLRALGLEVDRQRLTLTHTTTDELQVPVAAAVETGSGLHLVALDAGLPDDVDDLFATGAGEQGRLLDPVHKVGEKLDIVDPAEAVSALFAVDDPPRWVLVVAGRTVLLAERARWAEGRFLAVDLDTALERNDTSPKGEIETIAALFSTDALVPHDGQAFIDELADNSTKHAVGVSKELREGIRHSIEILANEVIQRRLDKNLGVYRGDNRIDPRDLTTQCLRYLYRLLVLLYAESRPELGIVPVDDEVYMAGYSLDRLRELTLTELDTDKARHGTHFDQSLRSLFELVNEGYHADNVAVGMLLDVESDDPEASYEDYLQFPGLDAQLFDPSAVPLIDSVTLRNEPLQKALQLLMLSPEGRGKRADRGFISYAQLGINQLGAVYEGLMAYTGFFADTDLYEVAKNGDPSDGTWMLPVEKADEYPEHVFVTREDPLTGAKARVLHPKGSFVFRLSGRDRQRSASYYTPEVLTRCVVKHALAELLGTDDYAPENGSSGITEARQILDLTICEPALGSGAFLNEAINQLSTEYLKRRQAELGETLDPEQHNRELQKVKAHFALHQSYGVDLNATAVELAEVSLWLNCMHPGLKAPWFGMQLRRGNSLIGCRRATWRAHQLKAKPWAKTKNDEAQPPVDRPLTEKLGDDELHHFLLPGHGWAAVANRQEAKELRPEAAEELKEWRNGILKAPSPKDAARLRALAAGIERLWAGATERLRLTQRSLRRPIEVWGAGRMATSSPADRRKVIEALEHPDSELNRLRLVMDAWVGLWFWELDSDIAPPTWEQWLSALEDLIGPEASLPGAGQLDLFDDLDALLEADEASAVERPATAAVIADHPWLARACSLARREGAWHWDLEFAQAFHRGGFDLQVGNPPWVRIEFDQALVVAERRPSAVLCGASAKPCEKSEEIDLLREVSSHAGVVATVSSHLRPNSVPNAGTNLYRAFMGLFWAHGSPTGVAGVLHPDAHLYDVKSAQLREMSYRRTARLFQFVNQLKLFEEIGNTRPYAVAVYLSPKDDVRFVRAASLFHPSTIDASLSHDGSGPEPSMKTRDGESWDLTPHRGRVVVVDESFLRTSAEVLGGRDDPWSSRLVNFLVLSEAEAAAAIADTPNLTANDYTLVSGLSEKDAAEASGGTPEIILNPGAQVLQSPHFSTANPFAQQTQKRYKNHRSYEPIDLEDLESCARRLRFWFSGSGDSVQPKWIEGSSLFYKRWCDPSGERTLETALMPPGMKHVESTYSISLSSDRRTTALAGFWASIPCDYIVKVLGNDNIRSDVVESLPFPSEGNLWNALISRTLRLNCLTAEYAPLWREVYETDWAGDSWALPHATGELGDVRPAWSMSTPLRRDVDRRQALVEIDALSAVMLGLTAPQLCSMYRTQFPVLRKYEYSMVFDAEGRKICKHHQSAGYRQSQLQQQAKEGRLPKEWKSLWKLYEQWEENPDSVDWRSHYTPPFYRPDREAEMTAAYSEFKRRLKSGFYDGVNEGAPV